MCKMFYVVLVWESDNGYLYLGVKTQICISLSLYWGNVFGLGTDYCLINECFSFWSLASRRGVGRQQPSILIE